MQSGEIFSKINKGFFWLTASSLASTIAVFILNLLIVRLLAAEYFGIMAIGATIATFLSLISSFGLGDALINRNENAVSAKESGFAFSLFSTTIFSAALLLSSAQIAAFFSEPKLEAILPLIVFGFFVKGIASVPAALLAKHMRFKTLAFFELVANISSPIAVIAAIFFLPQEAKYFALPAGFAFSSALYAVAVFSREKPVKPKLDVPETKRLLFFGSKVMLVELLAVFLVYGINLFVGKFFSIFELGLFSIAFTIANAPIELVSSSLFRVTYAGLSKEKSNKKNFSKIYEKISLKTLFILFPILSWLFVFAKPFNEIILKKDPMLTQLILAFCLFSFFRSMQKNCTSLFAGAGKPGMSLKLSVAETIVLAAIIFPLMQAFGFVGVVLALAGARMVSMIVAIVLSGNFVENSRAINASIAKSTASLLPIPVLFLILNSAIVFGMAGFLFLSAGFFLLFSAQYAIFGQLKKILE